MSKIGALTQAIRNARRRRGQSSRMGPESGQTYGAEVTGSYRGRKTYKPSRPMPAPDDMSLEATRARMEAAGFDPDSPVLYHTTRFGPSISSSPGMSFSKADREAQRAIFTSTDPKSTEPYGGLDDWIEMTRAGGGFPSESVMVPLRHRGELIDIDYPEYVRERFTDDELRAIDMDPYLLEEGSSFPFRRPIMSRLIDDYKGQAEGVRVRNMEDILPWEYEELRGGPDFQWPDQTVIFDPADLRVPWAGFRPEPDDVKINDLGYADGGALRRVR